MEKRPTGSGGEPSSPNCGTSAGVKARHLSTSKLNDDKGLRPLAVENSGFCITWMCHVTFYVDHPMAQLTGLFRRGGSYYLRIVLPENHPLRNQYHCGRWVQTLGPCSHKEAIAMGMIKRAEILTGFVQWPPFKATVRSISSVQPIDPICLRDIYARWIASTSRSADSAAACLRAVVLYEKHTGNPPLHLLTRAQGDGFRGWLQTLPTTSKTARDRMNWIKVLLKYAAQDIEAIVKSPWAGLDINSKTTLKRRPWSELEITKLLMHPIWQRGEIPSDRKSGGAAAYWVPLLAMYTGARCSELCQLLVTDIDTHGADAVITVSDKEDGQRIKSPAGHRTIPIHSELVRLGFVQYVRSLARSRGSVWPDLAQRHEKPGGYFSQFFGTLRTSLGIPPEAALHSFRHNVRSNLTEARVPETTIDRLLGHESRGSVGARIYTHFPAKSLRSAIETLSYPTATLRPWNTQ